jgi:hypothetical protein
MFDSVLTQLPVHQRLVTTGKYWDMRMPKMNYKACILDET